MIDGFAIVGRYEFAQQPLKDEGDGIVTNNCTDDWADCFNTTNVDASEPQTNAWEI